MIEDRELKFERFGCGEIALFTALRRMFRDKEVEELIMVVHITTKKEQFLG